MTTPAAPADRAFSTLVWNVQVPRRISATKPRSNSSKSVVLQPLAEASGGSSASPTLTARSRAVTLLEPELVSLRGCIAQRFEFEPPFLQIAKNTIDHLGAMLDIRLLAEPLEPIALRKLFGRPLVMLCDETSRTHDLLKPYPQPFLARRKLVVLFLNAHDRALARPLWIAFHSFDQRGEVRLWIRRGQV